MSATARCAGACVAAVVALAPGRQAAAQSTFTLDAGTASIRYDSAPGWSAATLTPALRLSTERLTFGALGTIALLDGFGWSSHGSVDASYVAPLGRRLHGELTALAEGGRQDGFTRITGQLVTQARLHWITATRGAWVGGGAGRAWNGQDAPGLALADAGAWLRLGDVTMSSSLSHRQFRQTWLVRAGIPDSTPDEWASANRRATDAAAQLGWTRGIVELGLMVGRRLERGSPGGGVWGGGSSTVWLSKQLAVVGSAGTYPGDLAQGLPRSRYATLALRLVPWGPVRSPPSTAATPPAFEVRDATGGRRTLVLRLPGAGRVELMGDFTDWQPLPMTRARAGDAEWTLTVVLPPGTHHVNIRVDGGEWRAPPGLTAAPDEFLGTVGILIVK